MTADGSDFTDGLRRKTLKTLPERPEHFVLLSVLPA